MDDICAEKTSQRKEGREPRPAKRIVSAIDRLMLEQAYARCPMNLEQSAKSRLRDAQGCAKSGDHDGVWYYLAKANDSAIRDGEKFPAEEALGVVEVAACRMLDIAADYLQDGHPDMARRYIAEANRFAAHANLDISRRIVDLETEISDSQRPR